VTEPFDRSLPSPIGFVLATRASAPDAVVAGPGSELQARMFVRTGLETRLLAAARAEIPPALIVLSGSAGGGKSALIAHLRAEAPDAFGPVLEDATHADAPDSDQLISLQAFFAPLADGLAPYDGRPLLAAMNTGMALEFFEHERASGGDRFTWLRGEVLGQLGLASPADADGARRSVIVVNLDARRTADSPDSMFRSILERFDPDAPEGIQSGSERCTTCTVIDSCFVRANTQMMSGPPVQPVLDALAGQAALERGRSLQPRALWDLASELATGGDTFPSDPCDRIAELHAAGDLRAVWDGLIWNGAFVRPSGHAARELGDPSFRPGAEAHALISSAGISGSRDRDVILALYGDGPAAAVVRRATQALALDAREAGPDERAAAGRSLVRAATLAGEVPLPAADGEFEAALAEYPGDWGPALESLVALLGRALAVAFGRREAGRTLFRAEAPGQRSTTEVLVEANLRPGAGIATIVDDPVQAASPMGAEIAGHRPLAVVVNLAGVTLTIDKPTYRLLAAVDAGVIASSADLEGFHALKRAAEALGRRAASGDRPLVIRDLRSGRSYSLARERDLRGRDTLTFREAGRG
jgi:hypothetical protein